MHSKILQPIVALLVWSLVIWLWMYATRIPAMLAMKMVPDSNAQSGDAMATLPPNVRWKADNFNHLMDAPTMFCAVALTLAVAGAGNGAATSRRGFMSRCGSSIAWCKLPRTIFQRALPCSCCLSWRRGF